MINPLSWLKVQKAEAHCDIPCGIYDPISGEVGPLGSDFDALRRSNNTRSPES